MARDYLSQLDPSAVATAERLLGSMNPDEQRMVEAMAVAYFARRLSRDDGYAVAAIVESIMRGEDTLGPEVKQIRAPTLVVWGRNDPIIPLRVGQALAADIPNARRCARRVRSSTADRMRGGVQPRRRTIPHTASLADARSSWRSSECSGARSSWPRLGTSRDYGLPSRASGASPWRRVEADGRRDPPRPIRRPESARVGQLQDVGTFLRAEPWPPAAAFRACAPGWTWPGWRHGIGDRSGSISRAPVSTS
jgi:hypothetical protein